MLKWISKFQSQIGNFPSNCPFLSGHLSVGTAVISPRDVLYREVLLYYEMDLRLCMESTRRPGQILAFVSLHVIPAVSMNINFLPFIPSVSHSTNCEGQIMRQNGHIQSNQSSLFCIKIIYMTITEA
jgi:hypothetical protein